MSGAAARGSSVRGEVERQADDRRRRPGSRRARGVAAGVEQAAEAGEGRVALDRDQRHTIGVDGQRAARGRKAQGAVPRRCRRRPRKKAPGRPAWRVEGQRLAGLRLARDPTLPAGASTTSRTSRPPGTLTASGRWRSRAPREGERVGARRQEDIVAPEGAAAPVVSPLVNASAGELELGLQRLSRARVGQRGPRRDRAGLQHVLEGREELLGLRQGRGVGRLELPARSRSGRTARPALARAPASSRSPSALGGRSSPPYPRRRRPHRLVVQVPGEGMREAVLGATAPPGPTSGSRGPWRSAVGPGQHGLHLGLRRRRRALVGPPRRGPMLPAQHGVPAKG